MEENHLNNLVLNLHLKHFIVKQITHWKLYIQYNKHLLWKTSVITQVETRPLPAQNSPIPYVCYFFETKFSFFIHRDYIILVVVSKYKWLGICAATDTQMGNQNTLIHLQKQVQAALCNDGHWTFHYHMLSVATNLGVISLGGLR